MMKQNLWISFLPAWILANIIGWFLFSAILLVPLGPQFIILSVAFILGLLQWLVLEKFLDVDWRWAAASMPIYAGVNFIVYFVPDFDSTGFLNVLILGLLGWLQYAVLNEYTNRAMLWILISPFAGFFGLAFSHHLMARSSLAQFWTSYGIVYGIITGISLVILITKPKNVNEINYKRRHE